MDHAATTRPLYELRSAVDVDGFGHRIVCPVDMHRGLAHADALLEKIAA